MCNCDNPNGGDGDPNQTGGRSVGNVFEKK